MIRKAVFILTFVVVSLQLSAQQEKSLLWEISGNGLKQSSYIFGTIHIIKAKEFFLTDVMKDKLKHSQLFITEIDMNIPFLQQLSLAKKMYLPDGKTLKDYMTAEEFQKFSTIVKDSMKLSSSKFDKYIRLKPFFLSSILIKQGIGKIKAYEKEMYKIAKNKGIPSDGLESIDFQFSLVDATPIPNQVKSLLLEINNFKLTLSGYDAMVKIYKTQDLELLYKMMVTDSSVDSDFSEQFINKRNASWIPKIEKRMKDYTCFIAVGSAHLPGEHGVLALLRKQGYTVTAVK